MDPNGIKNGKRGVHLKKNNQFRLPISSIYEIRKIQRAKGFAYRRSVEIPISLCPLFITRGDMKNLGKIFNVKMVFPEGIISTKATLDIYGKPEMVNKVCRLVQEFIYYNEKIEHLQYVSLEKFEELFKENPAIFEQISAESEVILKFLASPIRPNFQKVVSIRGKRAQIDKAVKLLAEQFFPKFKCAICFDKFLVIDGAVTCEEKTHAICVECFQKHAHYSIFDGRVAHGGHGLPCVDPDCKSIILESSCYFYVLDVDSQPLKLRLQQQCLIDADIFNKIVKCSKCSFPMEVDTTVPYYKCKCGKVQCRRCPRLYEGKHVGKTCEQMEEEEAKENSAQKLESKISEAIIRKCHKCNTPFVKSGGCNTMTCRCGATQCYICHAKDVKHSHFCWCGGQVELKKKHGQCPTCRKTCRNWERPEDLDEMKINKLKKDLKA